MPRAKKLFGLAASVSDQYEYCPGTRDHSRPSRERSALGDEGPFFAYCLDCGYRVNLITRGNRSGQLADHYRAKRPAPAP